METTELPEQRLDERDVSQVASLLRVGRNTVYALVANNQIPHPAPWQDDPFQPHRRHILAVEVGPRWPEAYRLKVLPTA